MTSQPVLYGSSFKRPCIRWQA